MTSSPAHATCAYSWYNPIDENGLVLDPTQAQGYIDGLPPIQVSYLDEPVPAFCVRVFPPGEYATGSLILRLDSEDLRSHAYARHKLDAVVEVLRDRGGEVYPCGGTRRDPDVVLDFSIVDTFGLNIPGPTSVSFARNILEEALRALPVQVRNIWIHQRKSSFKKLLGCMTLSDPSSVHRVANLHPRSCKSSRPEQDGDSTYQVTIKRPYDLLRPRIVNELVVYAGIGPFALTPERVMSSIQNEVRIYDQTHPGTPGAVSDFGEVTVSGAQFIRFACSHPALADILCEVDVGNPSDPAFPALIYHLNGRDDAWKPDKMRTYSRNQKSIVDARRGGKRTRAAAARDIAFWAGNQYRPRKKAVSARSGPPSLQSRIESVRAQIVAYEENIALSVKVGDGHADKHRTRLAALQEELRKLNLENPGPGSFFPNAEAVEQYGSRSSPQSDRSVHPSAARREVGEAMVVDEETASETRIADPTTDLQNIASASHARDLENEHR